MDREQLYACVKKLEEGRGFTPEGSALRLFIKENAKKNKTAALLKPKKASKGDIDG